MTRLLGLVQGGSPGREINAWVTDLTTEVVVKVTLRVLLDRTLS